MSYDGIAPWMLGAQIQWFQFARPTEHFSTDSASICYDTRSSRDTSVSNVSETSTAEGNGKPRREKQDRRRAQNRAAQRTYRERKESLRQDLETEVKQWQDRHSALCESYAEQAQELQRLKEHIEKLQMHVSALKVSAPTEGYLPSDFDLFPYVDWDGSACSVETPQQ